VNRNGVAVRFGFGGEIPKDQQGGDQKKHACFHDLDHGSRGPKPQELAGYAATVRQSGNLTNGSHAEPEVGKG
jgi:hypothetical protein